MIDKEIHDRIEKLEQEVKSLEQEIERLKKELKTHTHAGLSVVCR